MTFLRFVRENLRWLMAGLTLAFASSFGQTYFIGLFSGEIRREYDLSDGDWGLLYTGATLLSAAILIQAGKLADRYTTRSLAAAVIGLYALIVLAMAANGSWILLILIVAGLRFCGQGMMSHLAMTAMGRWFRASRGRAVAVAGLGFSLGEAVLAADRRGGSAAPRLARGMGGRGRGPDPLLPADPELAHGHRTQPAGAGGTARQRGPRRAPLDPARGALPLGSSGR